ncbi:DUF885 family protein, partial [Bacteroides fragilis]|nr:DUF885 family protein [Bacteroides fragilis]
FEVNRYLGWPGQAPSYALGERLWQQTRQEAVERENTAMDDANLNFEVNRYLGWPGQAPSYALGERLWQQTRQEAVE